MEVGSYTSSTSKRKEVIAQLSVDPQNKFWANDKSRFGHKMLEKMGWAQGKGLGKNEQGNPEYVKAQKMNDKEGNPSHQIFYLSNSGLGTVEDTKTDWKTNNL
jgi:hypothetical protein